MAPTVNDNTKERKSKWRLSNLLGSNGREPNAHDSMLSDETRASQNNDPSRLGVHNSDSAYGGSETTGSTEAMPTITDTQAAAQSAPVRTHVDQSTGKTVVTTVTTTTTTVTTTAGDVEQVPAGQEVVVRKEERSNTPLELSARPISRTNTSEPENPPIPQRSDRRETSPPRQQTRPPSPPVPVSPIEQGQGSNRHNFSYPARTPPPQSAAFQPHTPDFHYAGAQSNDLSTSQQNQPNTGMNRGSHRPRPPSDPAQGKLPLNSNQQLRTDYPNQARNQHRLPGSIKDLKAAAVGIQGASEAIRGTLNSTIDRRTGAPQEQVVADKTIAERGRADYANWRAQRHQATGTNEPQNATTPHRTVQPLPYLPVQLPPQQTQPNTAYTASPSQQVPPNNVYVPSGSQVGTSAEPPVKGFRKVLRKSREGLRT